MNSSFRKYPVLAPLSLLYRAVTGTRNFLYDKGVFKSYAYPFPVISVGNITVGGTGKTPHTQYIVNLLGSGRDLAVLSRGYGRCTSGFVKAGAKTSDSRSIGDEPLLMHTSFPDVTVAVDEDRVHGIRVLASDSTLKAVVLDDAFQHRRIRPSLNILLVDWNRNILDDMLLPAGRMRESAGGRRRADMIIVTKCPDNIGDGEMDSIAERLIVNPRQKVFFTRMEYGSLYPMDRPGIPIKADAPLLALTGIAQPAPMVRYLEGQGRHVELMAYPDHYSFDSADMERIGKRLENMPDGSVIITTQKDESRLKSLDIPGNIRKRIFVLPVKVSFVKDGDLFDGIVTGHVESFENKA